MPRPSLVGRGPDLLQLAALRARVLEEHIPQLVSIIAPAGTDKSRLLEEFLNGLDPADGFQIATVRSLPYLRRAGELAAHIGNFSEALTYLQHAIDIAPASGSAAPV